jgi:hypothetical protein
MTILECSGKTDQGFSAWIDWLIDQRAIWQASMQPTMSSIDTSENV